MENVRMAERGAEIYWAGSDTCRVVVCAPGPTGLSESIMRLVAL